MEINETISSIQDNLYFNPISDISIINNGSECPMGMTKKSLGSWGPSESGCNCYELTQKCSKACDILVEE